MPTRTTADWQALLDGSTPGPWRPYVDCGMMSVDCAADGTPVATDLTLDDAVLAASAPEAVAEVIRLREELEGLQADMRRQPHNILADEVASAIRIILRGDKS